jgi:hypothetical protein
MFLEVAFVVDGKKHVQRVDWYSTPQIVAEFSGNPTDRLEAGHLYIDIPITVYKAGYYIVRANLQENEERKRMVAQSTWEGELSAGAQVVRLQFFGKVINDSGIHGPYVVREIRAQRDNSPVNAAMLENALKSGTEIKPQKHTEPLMEYIKPAANYITAGYNAGDFSNDEWQSEQKERRLQYLRTLAEGGSN